MLTGFVWLMLGIIAVQAVAVAVLSGVVAWWFFKRRYVGHDDYLALKMMVDSNEKRVTAIENVVKPILTLSSGSSSGVRRDQPPDGPASLSPHKE